MPVRSITNETFDEVYNFLNQKVSKEAAQGFKNSPNKLNWLKKYWERLELDQDWTDKYKSIEDIVGDKSKTFPSLYNELNGIKPTDARFATIKKKYPWIIREDLDDWFDNTNEYKDYYKQERAKQAGKVRRQKEIDKDWSLMKKLLSSDYEKQRYIEDPQSAIFGKEAPGFFGSSAGAKADLISGLGAGVADVVTAPLPPINAVAGPSIRAGRDIAHIASDSPYQKEPSSIAKDFGTDVVSNAGFAALANARRGARIVSALTSPEVKSAYELSTVTDNIVKGLNKLPKVSNSKEFAFAVRDLPDSPLKQDLISTFGKNGKLVDEVEADKIIKMYNRDVQGVWQVANELGMTGINAKLPEHTPYLTQVLTTPRPQGIKQGIEYGMLRGMNKVNLGWPGTIGFETVANATGRGSKPSTVQTEEQLNEFNTKKNQYRQSKARFWSAGFRPKKMDGDPLWEAYKEWYIDTYGKDVEDK